MGSDAPVQRYAVFTPQRPPASEQSGWTAICPLGRPSAEGSGLGAKGGCWSPAAVCDEADPNEQRALAALREVGRQRSSIHRKWVGQGSAVRAVRPHELKLRHKAIPNQGIFNVISKQN